MISDNGSTFISGDEEIIQIMKNDTVNKYLTSRSVGWNFIQNHAPWCGGCYERLVGITKAVLKKTLGRSLVNVNQLNRFIVEIE